MYAIIETGGKQYRVTPGDVVSLEKLAGDVGHNVTFDKVLLVGGNAGKVLVGTPYVAKAALTAEIVEQAKGDKILTIKFKRRKGYRRMIGHRQLLTRVLVTKLDDGHGGGLSFDAAKRNEVLRKASVPYSDRAEKQAAKHAAASEKKPRAVGATKSTGGAKKKAAPKKK